MKWKTALALTGALLAAQASAASWQDQLSSAATQLNQHGAQSGAAANGGGLSLGALSGLLNGGNQALSAGSMTNAAGVLQYCVQNNLVNNPVNGVKDQLLSKLGLPGGQQPAASAPADYQQGLLGLLNTGQGQQVNLKALGETPLGKQVKTKACDLVLKQGKQFIS
nr:DUF2501 domain-containing protein [Pantoea sp. 1.19]